MTESQTYDTAFSRRDAEHLLSSLAHSCALVDAVTDDPEDACVVADQGYAVAVASGHLGVDEDVLQLLLAAETERS